MAAAACCVVAIAAAAIALEGAVLAASVEPAQPVQLSAAASSIVD